MTLPNWKDIEWIFENDSNSCLDIVIQDSTIDDWEKLIDLLNDNYSTCFDLSEGRRIPSKIDKEYVIKYLNQDSENEIECKSVAIDLKGVEIRTHFFQIEEIELDVSQEQINSNDDVKLLVDFMSDISQTLNKQIILTNEFSHNFPRLKIDSNRKIEKILTEEEYKQFDYKPKITDKLLILRTKFMMKFFPKLFVRRLINSGRRPIKASEKKENVW